MLVFFVYYWQALLYSLEHEVPLIAFSQDQCFTLFDHPLVDSLHTVYHEPKVVAAQILPCIPFYLKLYVVMLILLPQAEIMSSVEHLLTAAEVQIMAIGDGENDIEMLQLASLGIALANGSERTKAVADVIGACNDEDGVAKAIYEYAF
ncbi:hypothetical protein B296_00051888 [Ensete ventricosum]|uniref:Uncharacterized protein n=1 Tax=Ensete ventricosum TaxID=4639 RepID=A0A426YEU0_ENSVE|nr:hypothetical protein B296_00051888 [Ensete ventricosum]